MFLFFADDLQTMATLPYSLFLSAASGLVFYLFYLIWKNFHRASMIDDTPTARVRSAAQGYVELEGEGHPAPDQSIIAPLTGTSCVWYRYKIEKESRGSHRSGSDWNKVDSGQSEDIFVFKDGTGECLIDPRGAEVTPGVRKVWYGNSKWPGGAEKRGLLGELLGRRYRYTEERIDEGVVYVLGWFDTLRTTDTPLDSDVSTLLRNWKQDQAMLLQRFDTDNNGSLDQHEWQRARQQARQQALQQRAERSAEPPVNLVRDADHDRYPFLISAKPQFLLSDRYRRHAIYSLLGSLVAAGFVAWMLVARF
jgi:hypothetical protein